ncbi:MAG: hypothetical protein AAGA95_13880 [Pseudomonadota bacterium]
MPGYATPTIDGMIAPGVWSDAGRLTLDVNLSPSEVPLVPIMDPPDVINSADTLIGPAGDGINGLAQIGGALRASNGSLYVAACATHNIFEIDPEVLIPEIFDGTAALVAPCLCPSLGASPNPTIDSDLVPIACRDSDDVWLLIPNANFVAPSQTCRCP